MNNIRILIVDDEPDILDSFAYCLRKYKEQIHFASSGNNAISILKNYKINVIFSDFTMPDGSGIELYRYVEKNHKNIDFYFFTGNKIDHLLEDSLIKGIFNKPRDMNLMFEKVAEILNGPKG